MRRYAPFGALLVLLVIPGPARAQKCEDASLYTVPLEEKCGPEQQAKGCNDYLTTFLTNCTADALSQTGVITAVKKKSPPRSAEDEALMAEAYRKINVIVDRRDKLKNKFMLLNDAGGLAFPAIDQTTINTVTNSETTKVGDAVKAADNQRPVATVSHSAIASTGANGSNPSSGRNAGGLLLKKLAQSNEANLPNNPVEAIKTKADAGDLYLAAGDVKDADRVARDLVKSVPDDARGHALLAQTELAMGRPAEAAAAAKRALDRDPGNRSATETYGYAHSLLSKDALKRPGVRPGFDQSPEDGGPSKAGPGLRPSPGAAAPAAAPVAGAVPAQGRAPLSADVRKGLELRRIGDDMGALEHFTRRLDLEPGDLDARLERSDILLHLGKAAEALLDARAAVAQAPNDPRALRAEAAALFDLGRFAEALVSIDKALALDPANGAGNYARARILEKLGRVDEAIAQYKRAAALDPAVAVLAEAALKRLVPGAAAPGDSRRLMRGGLIIGSLILVLLGLLGGARVVTQRRATSAATSSAPNTERTFTYGDLVGGQYRITRELGRGGMGLVFEAVDETLKRPVALKQMQAAFRVSAEDGARFLQEARLVAQLKHPNIAEIHAAVDDGGLFLVFELIDGVSLDKALAADGALKASDARRVVADLCGALSCAHARRIIHRDLKPANVMRTAGGVNKVMDFGIAHQARGAAASTQTSASGTPPYMAPEQAMGTVLPASDLYALGVMTYELLSGARPFRGPDFLGPKMRGEFAPISGVRPGLPAGLDAFFASALAPDPSRRPADAETFRKRFEACWDAELGPTIVS